MIFLQRIQINRKKNFFIFWEGGGGGGEARVSDSFTKNPNLKKRSFFWAGVGGGKGGMGLE